MPRIVFDTSIYIPFYRREAYASIIESHERRLQVRLCSVVSQELYAGAHSKKAKRHLDAVNRLYERQGFLLTPAHEDWVLAGLLMERYIRLQGRVEPRAHINDVLILICAAKTGATLATENVRDYSRWQKMLRRQGRSCTVWGLSRSA